MLVLARKSQERLVISTDGDPPIEIEVSILGVDRQGQVKLGIKAPQSVRIMRAELLEEVAEDNRAALLPTDVSVLSLPTWPPSVASQQDDSEDNCGTKSSEL